MSLDNIWLRSNNSFVRVSCVRFVYCSFVCAFRIIRSFHFVRSFVRVLCVRFVYREFASCIVRFSYHSCEAFVRFSFVLFAFFVRLRLVRIVRSRLWDEVSNLYRCLAPYQVAVNLAKRFHRGL